MLIYFRNRNYTCGSFNFRKLAEQIHGYSRRRAWKRLLVSITGEDCVHPVDAIVIGKMLLVTKFILNVECQDGTTRDTKSQSGNIDNGKYFVFKKIAKCDLKVVLQHIR